MLFFDCRSTLPNLSFFGCRSHKYGVSDEGEPGDMCWMDRSILERFCATMSGYGPPYIVFPESVTRTDWSFYVKAKIPFPDKWRT